MQRGHNAKGAAKGGEAWPTSIAMDSTVGAIRWHGPHPAQQAGEDAHGLSACRACKRAAQMRIRLRARMLTLGGEIDDDELVAGLLQHQIERLLRAYRRHLAERRRGSSAQTQGARGN